MVVEMTPLVSCIIKSFCCSFKKLFYLPLSEIWKNTGSIADLHAYEIKRFVPISFLQ